MEVGVDLCIEVVWWHLLERSHHREARVVNEHIESSERAKRCVDGGLRLCRVGTSSGATETRSAYCSRNSVRGSGCLAVARSRSPCSRTCSAVARPRPLALPVISQTLDATCSLKSTGADLTHGAHSTVKRHVRAHFRVLQDVRLSRDTIRFYVHLGLPKPARGVRGGRNSYFTPDDLKAARIVRAGQFLGLSLKEIAQLEGERRKPGINAERRLEILRKAEIPGREEIADR